MTEEELAKSSSTPHPAPFPSFLLPLPRPGRVSFRGAQNEGAVAKIHSLHGHDPTGRAGLGPVGRRSMTSSRAQVRVARGGGEDRAGSGREGEWQGQGLIAHM